MASSLVPGSRDKRDEVCPGQTIHTISLNTDSNLSWDKKELGTEMGLGTKKLAEELASHQPRIWVGQSQLSLGGLIVISGSGPLELLRMEQRSVP